LNRVALVICLYYSPGGGELSIWGRSEFMLGFLDVVSAGEHGLGAVLGG